MTKEEFKEFCISEFKKRGFVKKRSVYYLSGEEILCSLSLQKSMAEAFYINVDYYIGKFTNIKEYPSIYEADFSKRITVLSRDTIDGKHFMDAQIEYDYYKKEEIEPYLNDCFNQYILPAIKNGKTYILEHKEYFLSAVFEKDLPQVLEKLMKDSQQTKN